MSDWKSIDSAPHSEEVMLWLRTMDGEEKPLGAIVGIYVDTDIYSGWCEKTLSGNMNTGLPQNLVTHWKEVGDGPE